MCIYLVEGELKDNSKYWEGTDKISGIVRSLAKQ